MHFGLPDVAMSCSHMRWAGADVAPWAGLAMDHTGQSLKAMWD